MARRRRPNAEVNNPQHHQDPPIVRPDGVSGEHILKVLRVPPESTGQRLDRFLQSQLRSTSRTKAKAIVQHSAYSPEGRPRRASERVHAEDRVVLWRPPFEDLPEDLPPLPIVYEDDHLLVVDKPAPLTVHPTARYYRNTVTKRLEAQRPGEYLSLIHRIDQETSGLLLVARSETADRAFKRMLEDRSVAVMVSSGRGAYDVGMLRAARRGEKLSIGKTYLAITHGVPPEGLLDFPIEADPYNSLRVKMRIAPSGKGFEARTEIRVLERAQGYALVECDLHTGRQHQIRLHLSHVGCPLVGDKLYGSDDRLLARGADGELTAEDHLLLELPRHALHAHRYTLTHAITGEPLDLVAPLAPDLAVYWAERSGADFGEVNR